MEKFFLLLALLVLKTYNVESKRTSKGCECGHGFGHPWYATLYCKVKDSGELTALCNAVLVSPWHVITASTCIVNIGKFNMVFNSYL